jgi:hypothetical protein
MKVNTKLLMMASALLMGALGIIASFMPQEILNAAGFASSGFESIVIQIMGALYLGFAMMNWMSKGITMGGIYARPLALGNFMHFAIAALALAKGATATQELKFFWVAAGIYVVFAVLFGYILFTHPLDRNPSAK